jgi:glycosyltransferase involved in cell wall biosynthesis
MSGSTGRVGVLFMQSQDFFGADSQIHASIMRHLPRDRFEVHCAVPAARAGVLSPSRIAVEALPDVRIRPTQFGPTLDRKDRVQLVKEVVRRVLPSVASLLGLARYVRRHRIAIVHCTEKPRDAFYGAIIARLGGARCVIHVHVKAETWMRPIVQRSMHRATALIGVSEFVAQSIRDQGYDASKVVAVPNGLELDEWPIDGHDASGVRREFGLEPDQPLIVSASRLYRYKGQHELLEALPAVIADFPNVHVLIVGADDPRAYRAEASYTDELKRICDRLGLWDHVVFTGWRSDVRALMAACDIYCMPSFEEPFGMVFTEAMALGKPVVAQNNGGTREVVDHGGSGLLSDPGDIETLSEHIVALLSDAELRHGMGEHGRARVIEHFSAERLALDVADVYGRLMTRS